MAIKPRLRVRRSQCPLQPVAGERARSGASANPWSWAALAVLLVAAAGLLIRRLWVRSKMRSRRFDPDRA